MAVGVASRAGVESFSKIPLRGVARSDFFDAGAAIKTTGGLFGPALKS
jgi:hypothetical protein